MTSTLYEPLDSLEGEIRLLKIEPTDGADNAGTLPVKCEMFTYSLTELKQEYHAVSYVWGDPADTEAIWINGQERQATRNLGAFSITADVPWPPHPIWVDALCIDQSNIPERNAQVQMMAGIYMMAKKTFSWLGPAADDSDYAMTGIFSMSYRMYEHRTALPSVAGEWRDPTGWLKAEHTYWLQRDLDDCDDALSRGATRNRFWRGARKLLARPYWDRAWVVQEVVLSRDVMVCCGTLHIPLGSIWLIALWLREIEGLPRPSFVDEMVWRQLSSSWGRILLGWASVLRLRKIREISRSQPRQDEIEKGGSTWRDLVVQTMGNQATDPRDKVYSVRGLLNLPIVPDYSRSVEEIYCDFATLCIQTDLCFNYTFPFAGHGLSLAASVTKPDSPPYRLFVPSWAPNWDMLSKERFFLPLEQGIRRENPEQGRTVDPRELSAIFNGRELNVGALPCDRVAVSRTNPAKAGHPFARWPWLG
jgi:hypothetical protein